MNIMYKKAGSPTKQLWKKWELKRSEQLQLVNSLTPEELIIAENCLKLCSIAATVILCGRQGFAFRGYDQDRFDRG